MPGLGIGLGLDTGAMNMGVPYRSVATVNNVNTPYQVLSSDVLIECDVTSAAVTVTLEAAPSTQRDDLIITNTAGDASVNVITISGNGKNVADPNTPNTFSSSVVLKVKGGTVRLRYDGTQWVFAA